MEERETIRLSDSEWRVMEELWTAPSTLMELVRTLGNKAGWARARWPPSCGAWRPRGW